MRGSEGGHSQLTGNGTRLACARTWAFAVRPQPDGGPLSSTAAIPAISAAVARIHADAYEREHERISTLLDDDLAMCILRVELSPAELLLIDRRHGDAVREQRDAFEQTLAPSMTAAVERATGRAVSTFRTTTHLEPSLTLILFMFA